VKTYACGFLIDTETNRVALIRKNRPTWQAGRLNAIGGKVEAGEWPLDAMRREFREETGAQVDDWQHIATVLDFTGSVYVYRHFDTTGLIDRLTTTTDEAVEIHSTLGPIADLMPIQTWLLPLALYRHGDFDPVVFTERENLFSTTLASTGATA
jgi:8-oxo-dGTP diphosphatase